ncbi:NADPH-dependent FMN reductase [Amycolatopsis thermophila]|uniref:NAD(P)H-dependent FMN reductase n=1 Tax=Amycolatopsis thermophila TaxID=206084 RepID=A0ABU0ENY9_9PSEU|nr:NADPH-dependent FMN reductase [Amycolatopsis thermophila]MDQ0376884.1 NAD(P)H-dependent FMN reductase [Amycolatopsis thermophila]
MQIFAVNGSMRAGSTNGALLATARAVAPGVEVYEGLGSLPHFNPDEDREPLPAAVADLRRRLADAGAVLFCTPEYAGALPGSFKNLLDWSVGSGAMDGKPVGWVNVSSSITGAAGAHASLRTVLGYLGTRIVEEACVHVPVTRHEVGADGLIHDEAIRARVAAALAALTSH